MPQSHVSQPAALTIGNFDGVHRGHAALVCAARREATAEGKVIALAFDPNPLAILKPDRIPPRLTSFDQRRRLLRGIGVDEVVRLEPTREFLRQTPGEFIEWCVQRWRPTAIVEGADFRFGSARAGSIATLREHEAQRGYRTIVVEPVDVALTDQSLACASSSLARWLLAHGRAQDAAIVLGRPYEVEAEIVRGDQRGRTIGFPTANLGVAPQVLPADGIYAGMARREGVGEWPAAISIGTKPTFGERPRTCEAHLLGYDGPVDDYGWNIQLRFTHWLRDQLAYSNVESLTAQLRRDVEQARRLAAQRPAMAVASPRSAPTA